MNWELRKMSGENGRILLSGWIARENLSGNTPAVVNKETLARAMSRAMPTVPARLNMVLEWLVRHSKAPNDHPLDSEANQRKLAAFSFSEPSKIRDFFIPALEEERLVSVVELVGAEDGGIGLAEVTVKGYARYEEFGRKVVYTCRADFVEALHFDTRQFNHLVWEADNLPDFRKALQNRIERAIGQGPKIALD